MQPEDKDVHGKTRSEGEDDRSGEHSSSSVGVDGDNDGEEYSTEVAFDLFDSGTIWTQVASTQLHCEAWRRGDNPRSDDDDRFGLTADVLPTSTAAAAKQAHESLSTAVDSRALGSIDDDLQQPRDEPVPSVAATSETLEPWWKKGKTAPLLDQFDEARRVWYLAQAGVYDHNDYVHDAQGVPVSHDDDVAVSASSHTPNARRLYPMGGAATPLPPSAGPQRAALTLAGNVNSPLAPATAAATASAALQTPKRKTWQSTWAQKEEAKSAAATANSSARKRRQSGTGGNGSVRTTTSKTKSSRGRGTGRANAPRSDVRTTSLGLRRGL